VNHPEFEIKKDLSISMAKANLYSLFFALPAVIILMGIYLSLWGKQGMIDARIMIYKNFSLSVLLLLIGVLLHELLHGLTWTWLGKKPFNVIRYGINLKVLSPYAHCREPLNMQVYRWGALMPGLVLGIIPTALGILSGNGAIMSFGLLFTVAAGGDAIILWILRKEDRDALVLDHPSKAGCCICEATADTAHSASLKETSHEI
jgi:hypothetical protein